MLYKKLSAALLCSFLFIAGSAQEVYIVNTKEVKTTIAPTMWGLFFEDINRGADGGLYAELVKNRSFDFPSPMMGWSTMPGRGLRDGVFIITNQSAVNQNNPKYMAVSLHTGEKAALVNEGFGGMAIKKDLPYDFTLRYRLVSPGVNIHADLMNSTGKVLGSADFKPTTTDKGWQLKTLSFTTSDTAMKGRLVVHFEGPGKIDIDRLSLFPTDTWKGRPGGLRADLVQKLADMKPGFLRFPGGCIVEGKTLEYRYQWKKTIGPLEDRKLVQSIWADDVPERPTPDYMESFGLGFYEYFQLCEDLGAAPLPILNCGMSCQFDAAEVTPIDELDPYIQDALDLIEFANGNTKTKWGARRAGLGHPESFRMTMLGVGNENWGPQYAERLALFTKAIKAKYPAIQIVNATGYTPRKVQFEYMDSVLRARHADIIDEHFYNPPEWFMQNAVRYDQYDRKGPKIFVGEYAAQNDKIGSLKNVNNLKTALSEACFMTGLERNADVVTMASYAPLLAHVKDWQWSPDLIWFDNGRSYNTPNYYVQQLFSLNKGTQVVPLLFNNQPLTGQDSVWASAVVDKNTGELIIKLVNPSGIAKQRTISLSDAQAAGNAIITTLKGDPATVNSLDRPDAVEPVKNTLPVEGSLLKLNVDPYSFNIIRVKLK